MPETTEHERRIGRIQDYLSGRLSAEEADAFEEQCLADEELAQELHLALEVRAAGESAEPWLAPPPSAALRGRWLWPAAAALVVLAVGLGIALRVDRGSETREPMRGEDVALELSLARQGLSVTVAWPFFEGAEGGYRAELFSADGALVASAETLDRRLVIPVPEEAAAAPLYARVQALGPLREVIAESSLQAVPPSGGALER